MEDKSFETIKDQKCFSTFMSAIMNTRECKKYIKELLHGVIINNWVCNNKKVINDFIIGKILDEYYCFFVV